MNLIDTTFGGIPAPLLAEWGQNVTYLKAASSITYNPTTGTTTGADTSITVRALILQVNPEEFEGVYQTSDVKVLIGNAELGAHVPSIKDRIQYTESGVTKTGRVIDCKTLRGDNPVLHTILLRPQ